MDTLTIVHVVLSLLTIVVGFVVIVGMVLRLQTDRWAGPFLLGTAATSITGFLFPFHGFTPAIGLGIISVPVLGLAILARYVGHLKGSWRWIYVITVAASLYFNVFVLVVQLFQKTSALKALAPTQSEPPFLIAQMIVLASFALLTLGAALRFRPSLVYQG
jgi:hypothetical protein